MRILLTECGFQGAVPLIRQMKSEGWVVYGTDMNPNTASQHFVDKFFVVKPGNHWNYRQDIKDIVADYNPNYILPASSSGIEKLCNMEDCIAGNEDLVKIANSKGEALKYLGFPHISGELIIKPDKGKGGVGITEIEGVGQPKYEGIHYDVDVLAKDGEVLMCAVKHRIKAYGGTLVEGEIVDKPEIVKATKEIIKKLPIDYLSVVQFIGENFIEINPRMAGVLADFNFVKNAVLLAEGKPLEPYEPKIGKKITRYMETL